VVAKVVRWLFVIVSAVPAALPVIFTVSMAVGSKELAKRGVLVTRLSAAEDAATMDVLCVGKTGTITMNQLAVTGRCGVTWLWNRHSALNGPRLGVGVFSTQEEVDLTRSSTGSRSP
jgi:P-type E1-E2 ATPase